MSTFEKVRDIIAEQLDVEAASIKPETDFENDLEADSLDVFQVISEIEDELDVVIDTEEELKTVQDLVNFIDQQ